MKRLMSTCGEPDTIGQGTAAQMQASAPDPLHVTCPLPSVACVQCAHGHVGGAVVSVQEQDTEEQHAFG